VEVPSDFLVIEGKRTFSLFVVGTGDVGTLDIFAGLRPLFRTKSFRNIRVT